VNFFGCPLPDGRGSNAGNYAGRADLSGLRERWHMVILAVGIFLFFYLLFKFLDREAVE
jgi:hypothetical protein